MVFIFLFSVPAKAQNLPAQVTRIEAQDRAPRCKMEDIVLLSNRLVEIQIFNKGTRMIAFHMPALAEKGGINVTTSAAQELGTNAYLIPPGQIGVVSLRTPESGCYFYACSELANRDPRRTGLFVIQEPEPALNGPNPSQDPSSQEKPKKG